MRREETARMHRTGRWPAIVVAVATSVVPVLASFAPATTIDVGRRPVDAAVLDVDADGRADLAVAVERDDAVVILRGLGDGTFGVHATIATDRRPTGLIAADVDRDGVDDLVVTHAAAGSVSLLRATGGAVFVRGPSVAVGRDPLRPAVGDLDGDGRPEIAIAAAKDDVLVVLDVDAGTPVPRASIALGAEPVAVDVADLDGDGRDEVVVVAGDAVRVVAEDGTGALAVVDVLPVGRGADGLRVADVDEDGLIDVVTANRTDRSLTVWYGSPAGPGTPTTHAVGIAATDVLAGDFDGDCRTDLLAVGSGVTGGELLSGTPGGFLAPVTVPLDSGASSWLAGDLDGDLRADLIGVDPVAGVDVLPGASADRCDRFLVLRSSDPQVVDAVAPLAETRTAPWTDGQAGTAGDVLFYRVRHAGGLDVRLSAGVDGAGVRLGFADGDPASAPVDPIRTSMTSPPPVSADGVSVAEIEVVPRDGTGVALGRGLAVTATLTGVGTPLGVFDLGNGAYAVRAISNVVGTAEVTVTVEGVVLPPIAVAFVAP